MDRRDFLKTVGVFGAGIGLAGLGGGRLAAATAPVAPNAERLGWRLGCQAWTFQWFTLCEAIDKTASLGLHVFGLSRGRVFSKDRRVAVDENSPRDLRRELKKKLADADVELSSYGVIPLFKDVGKSRKMFDFAKDMGIETLAAEPGEEDAFESLDRLCEEYGMRIAIHNHPKPSHYWNPDTVLKVCQGRSKRIGACADTGHWLRSGLTPLDCIKKLEGRIVQFHFKDLARDGKQLHDVPWGTGLCDVKAMLAEVRRQELRADFLVEYEDKWENNLPEIAKSIAYFEQVATELSAKPSAGTEG